MDPFVLKNMTFGIEDSVISISGALLGINAANLKKEEIVVSGFIVILVGALSMMYGSFVSDSAFLKSSKEEKNLLQVIYYSLVMFFSYFSVGLLLLSPFYFNLKNPSAYVLSYASVILMGLLYNNERDIVRTVTIFTVGMSLLFGSIYVGDKIKI